MVCFSLLGIIETIINVFNDNLEYVAILELLIIITLFIVLIAEKQNLEQKIEFWRRERDRYYNEYLNLNKTISNLTNKMAFAQGKKNESVQKIPLSQPIENSQSEHPLQQAATNDEVDLENTYNFPNAEKEPNGAILNDSAIQRGYQYMEPAVNGRFFKMKTSDDKCSFRTWLDNGVRKFEFCGNPTNALANFNATFDDSCEYEGKQSGASEIVNIEPGTLDDKLIIITKAKIRLQ